MNLRGQNQFIIRHSATWRYLSQPHLEALGSSSALFAPPLAAVELERTDPRCPVEAPGYRVVLIGIPKGTVVGRIDRH